jgi:hypothetical protein
VILDSHGTGFTGTETGFDDGTETIHAGWVVIETPINPAWLEQHPSHVLKTCNLSENLSTRANGGGKVSGPFG